MVDRKLETAAVLNARAWANRLFGQLATWNETVDSAFPGRIEEARLIALSLIDEPSVAAQLAVTIQRQAAGTWRTLAFRQELAPASQ
jgi:hypothetical protein